MKIWYLEIGEPLPFERDVRLFRCFMLSRALASFGHDVTWWTSNFSHIPKKFVVPPYHEERVEGVLVRALPGLGYSRNISLARFRHHADFARKFWELAPRYEKPDFVIGSMPTLDGAQVAVRFANVHNIPVLVDIRDEWPDEFLAIVPNGLKWLGQLSMSSYFRMIRHICRNATGIMAISRRQLDFGLGYAGRKQDVNDGVFPMGYSPVSVDEDKVARARQWWVENGVNGENFVACMFSSINKRVDLKTVIDGASILEKEFPVKFILCGDGPGLAAMRKYGKKAGSVIFPGWVNAQQITALMQLSHVGLVPYAGGVCMSLPNKPFEYFAGSLPVVSSVQGELRDVLAQNNCGITYRAGSAYDFCRAIRNLRNDSCRREAMGRSARKILEERFSTDVIYTAINRHLLDVRDRYHCLQTTHRLGHRHSTAPQAAIDPHNS